jgi:hypothetical protein
LLYLTVALKYSLHLVLSNQAKCGPENFEWLRLYVSRFRWKN